MIYLFITTLCLAIGAVTWALWRNAAPVADRVQADVAFYKSQLQGLDRDKARGVISNAEFETLRAEVARRLIHAGKQNPQQTANTLNKTLILTVGLFCVLGSGLTYATLGQYDMPDQPLSARVAQADQERQNRISQSQAEQDTPPSTVVADEAHLALVQQLRTALESRPNDITGHMLLAREESRLGNTIAAKEAQQRVVGIKGDGASAMDYLRLAETQIVAAGGYISPEAEDSLKLVLQRDPENPLARFRIGALYDQIGRPDLTFQVWSRLLEEDHPNAAFMAFIRDQIPTYAVMAGAPRYQPPAPVKGPTAEDVSAAANLSAEDRITMIEGMVASLGARLAETGGTAQEWARLITSLSVLGRQQQAQAVFDEAQSVFASDPSALSVLTDAAVKAGLR